MTMPSILHIRCGTDIRDALRIAGIVGTDGAFLEWADPVCQGPLRNLAEPAYLEERRAWVSAAWEIPRSEVDGKLMPMSSLLERTAGFAEVCLWFEHDLYDQSMLVQILSALEGVPDRDRRLRLVSIDRHPQLERFIGLGQLSPGQLAELYRERMPIPAAAFTVAARAWDALRQPIATSLRSQDWLSSALPFLGAAITRHLEEFPGRGGVGRTQRLILESIALAERSQGYAFAAQVFGELINSFDPEPWYGDLMFWAYLRELALEPGALITMVGEFPSEQLTLTPAGQAVLRGVENWLGIGGPRPHGPSRWRGGVEIIGAIA